MKNSYECIGNEAGPTALAIFRSLNLTSPSTRRRSSPMLGVRVLRIGLVAAFNFLCVPLDLSALVYISTADLTHNTSAPTGSNANSGWQWQGYWGGFLGTPIGPHHFLTAQHVGGGVGSAFAFAGGSYITTAIYNDSLTDLRICEVAGTFPTWAPLYRGTAEVGKPLVVFGRGLGRGADVRVNGILKGWEWGGNAALRWGQNLVAAAKDYGGSIGWLLQSRFDQSGSPEEAHLAGGDSSGPIFIQEGAVWKLAGINFAVDGNFNYTNTGSGFGAALFDASGLYSGTAGNWRYITPQIYPIPSSFYSTRVSSRMAWIDGIVPPTSTAEPTDVPLFGSTGAVLLALGFLAAGSLSGTLRRQA